MSNEMKAVSREEKNLLDVSSEHIAITPYGVEFDLDHKPSIEEWLGVVNKVQKVHGMMQFYLGDLMVFADSPVTGWGESKYADLIEATGYEYDVLKQFTYVARRFPIEFRKSLLERVSLNSPITFAHFYRVASLPDEHARYFLEKVAEGRWTVSKLRAEVERLKNRDIVDMDYENGEYVPTFNEVTKEMINWAKNFAKENEAEMVRVQIIKGGHVIEERTTEVY